MFLFFAGIFKNLVSKTKIRDWSVDENMNRNLFFFCDQFLMMNWKAGSWFIKEEEYLKENSGIFWYSATSERF